ncbi:MAG TPA: hypothetical protein VIM30_02235 [Candidatus Limnocylindrales bacterium]|jgi:hypothetical protein
MPSRKGSILGTALIAMVLLVIAVLAFYRADEDWRYQLAGLADPFLGRPAPGSTIFLGVIASAIVAGVAWALRRAARRDAPSTAVAGRAVRWRWWWVLVAAWGGYAVGAAEVIVGGGPVETSSAPAGLHASMRFEFRSPLNSSVEVQATCRSVVGKPDSVAEVIPTVDGLFQVHVRNLATGHLNEGGDKLPAAALLTTDGVAGNEFEPPNVPDRAAPYIVMTAEDGSTRTEPPIGFIQAYGYELGRPVETGLSGSIELTGTRFESPFGEGSARWVNLKIPDDPWPPT